MNRWLIIFGVMLIAAGLLWPVLQKIGLGRLPGDIAIECESFRFYFPIVTSLISSVVLLLILWLLNLRAKMRDPPRSSLELRLNATPAIAARRHLDGFHLVAGLSRSSKFLSLGWRLTHRYFKVRRDNGAC